MSDRKTKRGSRAGVVKDTLTGAIGQLRALPSWSFAFEGMRLRWTKTHKSDGVRMSIVRYFPRRKFAQVIDLRVHATERQLYLWFADGKCGYWDMSDIDPEPYASWDDDTFANWKVDAGMPCWGEDRHYSPDWAAKELVRMPYHKWLIAQEPEEDISL